MSKLAPFWMIGVLLTASLAVRAEPVEPKSEEEDEEEAAEVIAPVRPDFPPGTDPSLVLELGDPATDPEEKLEQLAEAPPSTARVPASIPIENTKSEPKDVVTPGTNDPEKKLARDEKGEPPQVITPTENTTPETVANTDTDVDAQAVVVEPQPIASTATKLEESIPVATTPRMETQAPAPLPPVVAPAPPEPTKVMPQVTSELSQAPTAPQAPAPPAVFYPGPYSPMFLEKWASQRATGRIPPDAKRVAFELDRALPPPNSETTSVPANPSATPIIDGSILPAAPEVSIILSGKQFVPSFVRLKSGHRSKLFVTSIGKKPSAIVIERLSVQRWVAQHDAIFSGANTRESSKTEGEAINREINSTKITEIVLDAKPGTYSFHDPLSGARGEIIIE